MVAGVAGLQNTSNNNELAESATSASPAETAGNPSQCLTFREQLDAGQAGELCGNMWRALAEQIAAAIPDIVINDDPEKAIRWATCAEACFWKATGECDTHDVKDVLRSHDAATHQ